MPREPRLNNRRYIRLFRGYSVAYGARGLSWWDYAWTSANGLWPAVSGSYTPVVPVSPRVPILAYGCYADMVLRASRREAEVAPGFVRVQ